MTHIKHLTGEKWLTLQDDKSAKRMRTFVGTREECEAVRDEWLAGNFSRGSLRQY